MRSHGGPAATWLIIACVRPCIMQTYARMRSSVLSMESQREILLQLKAGKLQLSLPSHDPEALLPRCAPSLDVRSSSAHRAVGICTTHVELLCSPSASAATEHGWLMATQLRLLSDPVLTPLVPIVGSSATPKVWAWLDWATCFPIRTQSASPFSARSWGQTTQSARRPLAYDGSNSCMAPRGATWQTIESFTPTYIVHV